MINKKRFEYFTIKTLLVLFSTNAFAQPATNTQSVKAPVAQTQGSSTSQLKLPTTAAEKPFNFNFAMETSSNLYSEDSYERQQSTSFMINPSLKIDKYKLSLLTYVEKEHTGDENTKLTNTDIALSFPALQINSLTKLSSSIKYTIPTSERSQKNDRLKGAAGASGKVTRSIGAHNISYGLAFNKNSHDYTTNGDGAANISMRLSQVAGVGIQINKKLSFDTSLAYAISQTYQEFRNYSYEYSADLSYALGKNESISIGASNGGSALKADGRTSNMALYDEDSTAIRASLSLSY